MHFSSDFFATLALAFLLLAPLSQNLVEIARRLGPALLDALLRLQIDIVIGLVLGHRR